MLEYILLAIGFLVLLKGADYLVDGASSLAKKLNVPDLAIGLTIVAFGTSMPELIVNIFASAQGSTEIAIGNILGSNTFNILFILGISALIYPLYVHRSTVWKEIPLSLLAAVMVGIQANDKWIDNAPFSGLSRIDGIIFLAFFVIFLIYVFELMKTQRMKEKAMTKEFTISKSCLLIIIGLLLLFVGGKWVVDGAVAMARALGVSEALIGLTIVAAGTSLPELATSAVAAYKKNVDIAVGNIVGSNIFNIFFILGVSAIIRPLPFYAASTVDISMTIFSSFVLFLATFIGFNKKSLERWEGALFILIYIAYVIFLIYRS